MNKRIKLSSGTWDEVIQKLHREDRFLGREEGELILGSMAGNTIYFVREEIPVPKTVLDAPVTQLDKSADLLSQKPEVRALPGAPSHAELLKEYDAFLDVEMAHIFEHGFSEEMNEKDVAFGQRFQSEGVPFEELKAVVDAAVQRHGGSDKLREALTRNRELR